MYIEIYKPVKLYDQGQCRWTSYFPFQPVPGFDPDP